MSNMRKKKIKQIQIPVITRQITTAIIATATMTTTMLTTKKNISKLEMKLLQHSVFILLLKRMTVLKRREMSTTRSHLFRVL